MNQPLTDTRLLVVPVFLLACVQGLSLGQEATTYETFAKGDPRGVMVEEVRNDTPSFMVRVDVDHADRIYRGGERMRVFVMSEKAGYLYLLTAARSPWCWIRATAADSTTAKSR